MMSVRTDSSSHPRFSPICLISSCYLRSRNKVKNLHIVHHFNFQAKIQIKFALVATFSKLTINKFITFYHDILSENGSENRMSFREFEEELVDIPQRDWRRIVLVLGLSWDLVQIGILGEKYERYDCDQTVTTRQTNQNKTKTIMIHRKNNSHKFFQPAKSVDKNLQKKNQIK